MKKIVFALLALSLFLVFTQCAEKEVEDSRTLITNKIQYDVPIVNPDASHDWWIRNIEGSDREELVNNIFDRVLSGEVLAYDYFNELLSIQQIESLLADTMVQTLMRPVPPYTEYDTMIIRNIGPADISILRFLEEWKYDEKSLQIDKKIYAISPVVEMKVNGQMLTRPLFWIYTDGSILKK